MKPLGVHSSFLGGRVLHLSYIIMELVRMMMSTLKEVGCGVGGEGESDDKPT